MKKYFFLGFIIIMAIYVTLIIFLEEKYNLSLHELDLNKNGFVSPTEILYVLDCDKRYKCYKGGSYIYIKDIANKHQCRLLTVEVYSLKDGLPIKEFIINKRH